MYSLIWEYKNVLLNIRIMEDEIEVSWFDGLYITVWQPSMMNDPENPRKCGDWIYKVPKYV